jgi:phosphatidylglycerol:prolipoprotein diacylglycerol transferase
MSTGFNIGPIQVRYYGLLIAGGIFLALLIIFYQLRKRNQSPDFLLDAVPWLFVGGVLGARIWHIFTPPRSMVERGITTRYYLTHLNEALSIWKGGVGIFGALLGGAAALWIYSIIKDEPILFWLDVIAPGLAFAQAVGRWGNFINREVYGLPTQLPWAIYISPEYRLSGFENQAFYHPLFFYEMLLSLVNVGVLLWLDRKYQGQLKTGTLILVYAVIYSAGRAVLEFLRLDVSTISGVNINQLFAALMALVSAVALWYRYRKQSER